MDVGAFGGFIWRGAWGSFCFVGRLASEAREWRISVDEQRPLTSFCLVGWRRELASALYMYILDSRDESVVVLLDLFE